MLLLLMAFVAGCGAMYYAVLTGLLRVEPNTSNSDSNSNNGNDDNGGTSKTGSMTDGGGGNTKSRALDLSSPAKSPRGGGLHTVDGQHVNLITDVIQRLWPYINRATATIVRETVEPQFAETLPGPLKSLHFTKLDLGRVPIRMDNVVVHPVKDGSVQLDMDIVWKSDSDIRLKADYTGSFGVKSICFQGRVGVLMKPLLDGAPIVGALQVAFLNPPTLTLDFSGLASIADFSVIERTIQGVIQSVLCGMLVLPHRLTVKLDPGADLRLFHAGPVGVARVRVVRGRGFQVERKRLTGSDVPDVYVKLSVGTAAQQSTSVQKDSLDPVWPLEESFDFLLSDNDQVVSIEAWDQDNGALDSDDFLGGTKVSVGDILLNGKTLEVELQKKKDNKNTGAFVTLHCDVVRFTSSPTDPSSSLTSTMDNSSADVLGRKLLGLKTVIITEVNDLPMPVEQASSFVKVVHGEGEDAKGASSSSSSSSPSSSTSSWKTGAVVYNPDVSGVDFLNPTFDAPFLLELTSLEEAKQPVRLLLMNDTDKVLAETIVTYDDLLGATDQTVSEKRVLSNGASLSFSVSLQGMQETGVSGVSVSSELDANRADDDGVVVGVDGEEVSELQDEMAGDTVPERVRISINSGSGFQITKHKLRKNDVPDVYVNVRFGSSPTLWRTGTVKNSVSPEWPLSECKEYVLTSNNQVIALTVMDQNRRGKDDLIGTARITVGQVLLNGGKAEVELVEEDGGNPIGAFITLSCERV